jgi:hypothetical protein
MNEDHGDAPSTPVSSTRMRTKEPRAPASPLDEKLLADWRERMLKPLGQKPQQLNTAPAAVGPQTAPLLRSSTVAIHSSLGGGAMGVSFSSMGRLGPVSPLDLKPCRR